MSQTITNALTTYGVIADTTGLSLNGNSAEEIVSDDVFNENFNTCVDIKFSKLEDNWIPYSGLTVAKGRIRLRPKTKVNTRAFLQWSREKSDKMMILV